MKELPSVRVIDRICAGDRFPEFPEGKVAVFVGSHPKWTSEQTEAVDRFCEAHDAVVFAIIRVITKGDTGFFIRWCRIKRCLQPKPTASIC